ncbi:phytosulfokine receptor 1 [Gossypium raimondii]|uniref:phytosulfokine receptor 1 n=1 Tax=Gossypium raimondii TaxID=29730 RepID=UPI00227B6EE0|nr:phytosulfokine receptor 1 [Gossypium raimondii]
MELPANYWFNKFTGPIWPSFGKLKNLHVEFGRNNLSRSIPDSISGMISLEVLGLSPNNISGDTPHSLVHLSFLSVFNVSYNRLYGEIPSEGQFMTFPEAGFEGNEALWFFAAERTRTIPNLLSKEPVSAISTETTRFS